MSNLQENPNRRPLSSWQRKLIWLVLGVAVFAGAYFAGQYVAPVVAVFVRLMKAIFNVLLHPPSLP